MKIPESHRDLLRDDIRAFVYLATQMADGSPQVTPVWFNTTGEYILVNSAKGRVKDKNMRRHPMVALCIQDPANPYRYVQVRGKVVEITEEDADAHIDTNIPVISSIKTNSQVSNVSLIKFSLKRSMRTDNRT
jgi:PPOX class probable F420-dependent enzyme